MKKVKSVLERISEKLDLPRTVVAGLPQTIINGFGEVSIDLQRGLLDYSDTKIVVAVSIGKITVSGSELQIRLMKEGRITVVGKISDVSFSGETTP